MHKKGRFFAALLLCLLVFAAQGGKCHAKEQSWVSLAAGQIQLPDGTRIVEIDILSLLDLTKDFYVEKEMLRAMSLENRHAYYQKLFEILNDQSLRFALRAVNLYLVNVPDGGNDYYTAWLVTVKSNKETEKFLPDVFKGKMTEQKKEQALAWYEKQKQEVEGMFPRGEKPDFAGPARKVEYADLFGYKLSAECEWQGLDFITINKKPALSHGVRLIGENGGLFSAFYVKRYMFGAGKKPASLAIVAFDSERSFWTRAFDRIMADGFKPSAR
ncbi:MAG: hypothetical protein LBO03_07970 [Acidaminococcales bacterium]|jgi:hypothetical protein|nr:hypothetical protein [Acidaminococcales bacterium]